MSTQNDGNPLKLAVLATLAAIVYLDAQTPPDQPATLAQIMEFRKISTSSATRHLKRLEEEGYIRRVYEPWDGRPGVPIRIEVLKAIPPEVLESIPAHDMYNPRNKAHGVLWDILTLYVDIFEPLTKPVGALAHWVRRALQ